MHGHRHIDWISRVRRSAYRVRAVPCHASDRLDNYFYAHIPAMSADGQAEAAPSGPDRPARPANRRCFIGDSNRERIRGRQCTGRPGAERSATLRRHTARAVTLNIGGARRAW
jgi:hypothetical protein